MMSLASYGQLKCNLKNKEVIIWGGGLKDLKKFKFIGSRVIIMGGK
jgi:hypothetical protein